MYKATYYNRNVPSGGAFWKSDPSEEDAAGNLQPEQVIRAPAQN
jgi:hypothetical protein